MSRRNRHARHQQPAQAPRPRPASPTGDGSGALPDEGSGTRIDIRSQARAELRGDAAAPRVASAEAPAAPAAALPQPASQPIAAPVAAAAPAAPTGPAAGPERDGGSRPDTAMARPTCTVAQLRRFIKSRPWIPLHELRRRFGIYGGDDDVSPIRVGDHVLFIGLPPAESSLIAELLAGGDVGYELGLDPRAPIVVGVYPMRPVPRG